IRALGCIDPADLLDRAGRLLAQPAAAAATSSRIVVAGFYDMTGAQLRLIEALRASDRLEAIFIPATDDGNYAFAGALIGRFRDEQESAEESTSGASSRASSSVPSPDSEPPSPSRGGGESETNPRYLLEAHRTA